ncbi:TetR/AcrR family transcriptional regulator [Streptomyces sp. NBC_01497]|uniref:TetR/AcrR family transcriptional regulator n=1 Tax=Streptomyces sp. NBC_01497 TaxID=2903885 RepID=UPI002E325B03|nr:TetR family transcriptional regulator [Streptomyces sp. NBC_01497]
MRQDGLRERKKRRRFQEISDAAIALFMARGFENVPVAEIAAAVEISKPTLFRYFPSKEDLVLHRFADHEDEAARVVRAGAADGVAPLEALLRHLLDGLGRHDPVTGLNDDPRVLAYHRLLYGTPGLAAGMRAYQQRSEAALADALREEAAGRGRDADPLAALLAAVQIVAVQRVLAEENWRRIAGGEPADAVRPDGIAAAEAAFRRLREGLGA